MRTFAETVEAYCHTNCCRILCLQLMSSLGVVGSPADVSLDGLNDSKLGVSYLPTVSGGGDASGSQTLDAAQAVGVNSSGCEQSRIVQSCCIFVLACKQPFVFIKQCHDDRFACLQRAPSM